VSHRRPCASGRIGVFYLRSAPRPGAGSSTPHLLRHFSSSGSVAMSSDRSDIPVLLRVREAAALLGVSERVLYSWAARKVIPSECVVRSGRALYFSRPRLLQWLGAADAAPRPPATAPGERPSEAHLPVCQTGREHEAARQER
jgi:excisionase family DNA binding protein